MNAKNLKPAARLPTLVFLAGALWLCAGSGLTALAVSWLLSEGGEAAPLLAAAGFGAALLIHHFGFLRVADKNLGRLLPEDGPRCLFAFISWKSWLLAAGMMSLGWGLRHSALPKRYLAVLYSGIGLALALSSVRYFRTWLSLRRGGQPSGGQRPQN